MASQKLYLGIADSHDAGVAVIDANGHVVAAVNEERLCRKKMASGFPRLSLEYVLDRVGVRPSDIAAVGLAGRSSAGAAIPLTNDFSDENGHYLASQRVAEFVDGIPGGRFVMSSDFSLATYRAAMRIKTRARIDEMRRCLAAAGINALVTPFDHHDAHLASAYYASGQPGALVVSNDGFGDGLCSKVALGDVHSHRLAVVSSNSFFNSLGVYYNFATLLCGFPKAHHAGKTTGLAALGDPSRTREIFARLIQWDQQTGRYVNRGGVFRNCIAQLRHALAGVSREDIAAGIQSHCEDVLVAMVSHYLARTERRNLVLVGGVHANVKANQRIAEIPGLDTLFIFPNMGDGGLALGAAYLAADANAHTVEPALLQHAYLGPNYSEDEIESAVRDAGLPCYKPQHYAAEVARLLADEKVVARFDGGMEYGPRALGNRSILYSATKPEVNKWLNQQLNRTEFMPFAPVLREQDAPCFLENFTPVTAHSAEFMTLTYNVTPRCKREAPAIVHVDGTARPQVVRRSVNPAYHDILTEYHALTGLSILVNTSFNMHEEPIVCSPGDAIRAFLDSNIDVLALGSLIVTNPARTA